LSEIGKQLQNYYSISCPQKEVGQIEHLREEKVERDHTPPLDSNESTPRKKRKIENYKGLDDCEARTVHNTDSLPETHRAMEDSIDSDTSILIHEMKIRDNRNGIRSEKRSEPHRKTSETCQLVDKMSMSRKQDNIDNSFTFFSAPCATQVSKEEEKIVDAISKDPLEVPLWPINNDEDHQEKSREEKSKLDCVETQAQEISNPNELEHLWESVTTNDLNEISMCLDALESSSQATSVDECNKAAKGADIVGSEAWSMGLVSLPKGDTMKVI